MKLVIYSFIFLLTHSLMAQNQNLFEHANGLYNQGKYNEAITNYKTILETNNHSAELYFNLGNAYYKLNKIAPSIYYYEKALQLNPNDKAIAKNLAFAQQMTVDAIETVPEIGVSKFIKNIANTFSFDGWAKLAVSFMILTVILFLIYYFSSTTTQKRFAFISSLVGIVLTITALSFAFYQYNYAQNLKPAIVFTQETQVKNEPNLRSQNAFILHEGTKVYVLDTLKNWKHIKLLDGKTGWIPSQDIKLL